MKPITPIVPGLDFPVTIYAKDQPEYLPLPSLREPDGTVITRWALSWKERLQVLWGGSLWLEVLTFNTRLQPVRLSTSCPISRCAIEEGK